MTDIDNPTRELLDRRQQIWARQPSLHYDQVAELAEAELRFEAEQQAASDAKNREMTDSFARMLVCPSCGTGNTLGNRNGLCDPCGQVATVIRHERAATETVQGRNRRQLVEAFLDRTGR